MANHILVDSGALQMIFNAVERISKEQGRPVLQEMVEEVKKSCIVVEELKIVDGPNTRRGWVEDIIGEDKSNVQPTTNRRDFSRFPKTQIDDGDQKKEKN